MIQKRWWNALQKCYSGPQTLSVLAKLGHGGEETAGPGDVGAGAAVAAAAALRFHPHREQQA